MHNLQNILDQQKKSLIEIYLELQQAAEARFGKEALVIIEVGSFFEVYGVDNDAQKIGKPKEIAELLNLQLTRKNKSIIHNDIKNPLLAGFPTATLERYMNRLVEEKRYTIVLVRQRGTPPEVTRYIDSILSPGVNFEFQQDHDETLLVSLTIDCDKRKSYVVGYTSIDVSTGKIQIAEFHSTKDDPTFALDEALRFLHSGRTQEVILHIPTHSTTTPEELTEYLELHASHHVHEVTNDLSTAYQNEICKRAFAIDSMLSPLEVLGLERQPCASMSLAHALSFIIDHDAILIEKLSLPEKIQDTEHVYLGNDPLRQLNIISENTDELSILRCIDKTRTSIGRRLLKDRLLHPIVNAEELWLRYDLADACSSEIEPTLDQALQSIYDLERLHRRITLGRLHPFEMNFLVDSLKATKVIAAELKESKHPHVAPLLSDRQDLSSCIKYLEKAFNLDATAKVTSQTISENLFQRGVYSELDALTDELHAEEQKLLIIRDTFISLLSETTGKDESQYVLMKQLDKEGHYLSVTKSRYALVEEKLKHCYVTIDETVYAVDTFRYLIQKTNVKITAPIIDDISTRIISLQQKIVGKVRDLFQQELGHLSSTFGSLISTVSLTLARIDVALSTQKTARDLRLTRPEILDDDKSRFLELQALRHPLVEANEDLGIYIPNDIALGSMHEEPLYGMLLYGINASGKSSLMKSIGVAVMLAQAGFFVPAHHMRFTLFHELFTRIIAKDNLEKGLSSFAVEMIELRNILQRASDKSLVLGDEICHGTETVSALAIVSAAIERLREKQAFFVLTTHFHQLEKLELLKKIDGVVTVHLAVHYDKEKDLLIFDRTLQPGNGSSIYGLEFARSLHMDVPFLKKAEAIRKKLTNEYSDLELLASGKVSTYHKEKYLTRCAVCHTMSSETHHIAPQELADANGNIDHFHKNHKANLVALCDSCHDKIHRGTLKVHGYVMTSKGRQLQVEEISSEVSS